MHAILFLSALLFALIALSLRVFKNASSLTFVDYSRITDKHALHRGVAARFLVLAAAHFLLGVAALSYPSIAEQLVALGFFVLLPAVTIWLVVSARRLQVAG